jgi:hypothetical protein
VEEERFSCLLCTTFNEIFDSTPTRAAEESGLNCREQKLTEKFVLELFCKEDLRVHFKKHEKRVKEYFRMCMKQEKDCWTST